MSEQTNSEQGDSEVVLRLTVRAGVPITSLVVELLDSAMAWAECQRAGAYAFARCEVEASTDDDGPKVLSSIWGSRS